MTFWHFKHPFKVIIKLIILINNEQYYHVLFVQFILWFYFGSHKKKKTFHTINWYNDIKVNYCTVCDKVVAYLWSWRRARSALLGFQRISKYFLWPLRHWSSTFFEPQTGFMWEHFSSRVRKRRSSAQKVNKIKCSIYNSIM